MNACVFLFCSILFVTQFNSYDTHLVNDNELYISIIYTSNLSVILFIITMLIIKQ